MIQPREKGWLEVYVTGAEFGHIAVLVTLATQMFYALSEKRIKLICVLISSALILDICLKGVFSAPPHDWLAHCKSSVISISIVTAVAYSYFKIICRIFHLEGQSFYWRGRD